MSRINAAESFFPAESLFIESVHLLGALHCNVLLIFAGTRVAGSLQQAVRTVLLPPESYIWCPSKRSQW